MDGLDTCSPALRSALWISLAEPNELELSILLQQQRVKPGGSCLANSDPRLSKRLRETLGELEKTRAPEHEWRQCRKRNFRLVPWFDPTYPATLLDLVAPPIVLYLRGRGPWPPARSITIVGARKSTVRGRSFARELGAGIAQRQAAVISGLARGIDQAAHEGSVRYGGGCYAVLACGVDRIYPRGACRLAKEIEQRGRIVSEMPIGFEPYKHRFPRRNRILAAWSPATAVIEADERSGSLITAHRALELGREVFAVPGPIREPSSRGTNLLIRDGATPLLGMEDLDWLLPHGFSKQDSMGFLGHLLAPKTPAQLAQILQMDQDRVLSKLLDLELEGKVRNLGGGIYGTT